MKDGILYAIGAASMLLLVRDINVIAGLPPEAAQGIELALGFFLAQPDGGHHRKQGHEGEQVPVENG